MTPGGDLSKCEEYGTRLRSQNTYPWFREVPPALEGYVQGVRTPAITEERSRSDGVILTDDITTSVNTALRRNPRQKTGLR